MNLHRGVRFRWLLGNQPIQKPRHLGDRVTRLPHKLKNHYLRHGDERVGVELNSRVRLQTAATRSLLCINCAFLKGHVPDQRADPFLRLAGTAPTSSRGQRLAWSLELHAGRRLLRPEFCERQRQPKLGFSERLRLRSSGRSMGVSGCNPAELVFFSHLAARCQN